MSSSHPLTLGQLLRSRRIALKMTQQKLADAIGWKSVAFVSDLENDVRNVGEEYMEKLAEVLGVGVSELKTFDTRTPVREAKDLLRRNPEYASAFRQVVSGARRLSPEALAERIEKALAEENPPPSTDKSK
ncbi:MAG: helix-turn-helix transcriptional regulator [Terrimicrobiaceae bacterium]|nr:helix-turn-helix transcriptional regulator [Terrimicrobiaceae bacterium]